jgi:tRNA(adenine34) deaminase
MGEEAGGGLIGAVGAEAEIEGEFGGAMRLALDEARRAGEAGDVPVGAVVLDASGAVIGAGHNDRERSADPTGHAEVVAMRAAAAARGSWRLDGCTLVVTLEPCTMCAGAAVQARVDRVVYGAVDLKAGAVGSLWDVVRDRRLNHRPEVIAEVMAEECGALLVEFFAHRRVR